VEIKKIISKESLRNQSLKNGLRKFFQQKGRNKRRAKIPRREKRILGWGKIE
jgi:hypothetical protein